jgi:hypothetical protein
MAVSAEWKQNVAGGGKIMIGALKSPSRDKILRNNLSALRSFITNSNLIQHLDFRSLAFTRPYEEVLCGASGLRRHICSMINNCEIGARGLTLARVLSR